jgi:hypothetical protein
LSSERFKAVVDTTFYGVVNVTTTLPPEVEERTAWASDRKTILYAAAEGRLLGAFAVEDEIRTESREAVTDQNAILDAHNVRGNPIHRSTEPAKSPVHDHEVSSARSFLVHT